MASGSRLHVYADFLNKYNSLIFFRAKKVVNNGRNYIVNSVVNCSTSAQSALIKGEELVEEKRIDKAVRNFIQRSKDYEIFLKEQLSEFEKGKAFLAKIMGKKSESFDQNEIDEAIKYLFPSALHEPLARPMFKHPDILYAKRKEAHFDSTGRPHHYLFYTVKPNFSQALHECAVNLQNLNDKLQKMGSECVLPKVPLNIIGSEWLSKSVMEGKFMEKLLDIEYQKFIEAMERLSSHPYSYEVAAFIMKFRTSKLEKFLEFKRPEINTINDISSVTIDGCRRKKCTGTVTLLKPGTGKIIINGKSLIDFFEDLSPRQELSLCHIPRSVIVSLSSPPLRRDVIK